MGKKDSGGSSVDPEQVAQAQASYNRINQQTPFGSLKFSNNGRRATTTLTPEQQALLDQQQRNQALAGSTVSGQLAGGGPDRSAVEQAAFARELSLLNPAFTRREGQLQQQLADRGLPQASAAYGDATGRLSEERNRALEQAAYGAVLAGGQDQNQQLAQLMALAGYAQPAQPTFFGPGEVTYPIVDQGGGGGGLFDVLGKFDPIGRYTGNMWGKAVGGGPAGGLLAFGSPGAISGTGWG